MPDNSYTYTNTGAAFFKREIWAPREKTVFNTHLFLRTENAIQGALKSKLIRLRIEYL